MIEHKILHKSSNEIIELEKLSNHELDLYVSYIVQNDPNIPSYMLFGKIVEWSQHWAFGGLLIDHFHLGPISSSKYSDSTCGYSGPDGPCDLARGKTTLEAICKSLMVRYYQYPEYFFPCIGKEKSMSTGPNNMDEEAVKTIKQTQDWLNYQDLNSIDVQTPPLSPSHKVLESVTQKTGNETFIETTTGINVVTSKDLKRARSAEYHKKAKRKAQKIARRKNRRG